MLRFINGEGTVTLVKQENENSYTVVETIETQKRARTITLNKTKHQLYLPTAEFGETSAATKENPRPILVIKPNTFGVLVVE